MSFLLMLLFAAPAVAGEELTLDDCISIALKNNSEIKISGYSVRGAQYDKKGAFTGFLPSVSAKASYLKFDEVPTSEIPGFGSVPIGTEENVEYSVNVTQPIFTGGRIKNNYAISKNAYDSAKYENAVVKKDIVARVTRDYFNVLKLKKLVEIATSSKQLISLHLKDVDAFYETGIVSKNDLLSVKVSLANAESFLIKSANQYELVKSGLNFSLNRDLNMPVVLQDVSGDVEPFELSLKECTDRALTTRDELKAISSAKSINESMIDLKRSAYYPQIYFVGSYTESGEDSFTEDYYSALITMELDIFSWGRDAHAVESSKMALKRISENEVMLKNSIALGVKSAYLQLKQAVEEISATKQAVEQAEENYRIYEEKFKVNVATSTDVLDAENLTLSSKINYFQALYDFYIARIDLKRAMGDINF